MASNKELPNAVAEETVNKVLKDVHSIFTNKTASDFICDTATKLRILLTAKPSTENVKNLAETVSFLLQNPYSSKTIADICDVLLNAVYDGETSSEVLVAISEQLKNLLNEPKAPNTIKALISGLNIYLDGSSPGEILSKTSKLQNMFSSSKAQSIMNMKPNANYQTNTKSFIDNTTRKKTSNQKNKSTFSNGKVIRTIRNNLRSRINL